jgi:transposase
MPDVPLWVVGDKGYSSNELRETLNNKGSRVAIATRSNEAAVACPEWIYTNRNMVERLWARLKEWRAVATRYEKTANSWTPARTYRLCAIGDSLARHDGEAGSWSSVACLACRSIWSG